MNVQLGADVSSTNGGTDGTCGRATRQVRVHKKLAEDGSLEASRTDQLFEFDEVFGMDSAQEEVFQQTRALLQSCFDGFNVTMLAYGQTGAGEPPCEGSAEAGPPLAEEWLVFACGMYRNNLTAAHACSSG